jgi:hypothetical protein
MSTPANALAIVQPPTIDQLEDEITTLCAHLGAAEHRLLVAIGEFDARGGWTGIGIASCAHWLGWKCGISLPAAHERVRIARALRQLPLISTAMSCGELSYSKVRALTRAATPANEVALVRLAKQGTASHIEEIVRRYRRVCRADDTANAAKVQRAREVRYRWDDDGTFVLHARLPPEQGALVLKALQAATDTLRRAARGEDSSTDDSHKPPIVVPANQNRAEPPADGSKARQSSAEDWNQSDATDRSFTARRADALVLMAETTLRHGVSELPGNERHQVVIHVDAATLAAASSQGRCELEHGPALAIETARRLICDTSVIALTEAPDGSPLDVGRRTRSIPTALRRALQSRDHGCRFPGCSHKVFTEAHHIQHWADGGETKLHNLVLLCRTHHRLVHEEGFTVEQDREELAFRAPNGKQIEEAPRQRVLLHDPVLALISEQAGLGITARTTTPEWMGEIPAYDWITDTLWRRDRSAVQKL